MAEARGVTLKSGLSRTLRPAMAVGLEPRPCRSAASTPPAQTPPTTPPPFHKYRTLAKCCSLDIMDQGSGDDSPELGRKHSADIIDVVPGLYKHSQSHPAGFYGSQENLRQFLKLPEKGVRLHTDALYMHVYEQSYCTFHG